MKTFALTTAMVLGFALSGPETASAGGVHFYSGPYGTGFGLNTGHRGHLQGYGNRVHVRQRGHYHYHDTSHFDYVPGRVVPHRNHFHYIPGGYQFHREGHYDYHRGGHRHHH